ncbi:MAG: hypothetical protein OES12_00610 [Anaerolineae bacterium]|nr:hypothetical protein [Anaerolineae bacterium]
MTDTEKDNGTGDVVVEEPVVEEAAAEEKAADDKGPSTVDAASKTINEAFKQVEKQVGNISKALGSALQDRANVVMVRVNDDSLHYLDMLVEADITKSRSESAAFLINEGIKVNESLFNKIREITDQIVALKSELREVVAVEDE